MKSNSSNNQKVINQLRDGIDKSWDLFMYGDKKHNIKPGNVEVYGSIAGQREVLKKRMELQDELDSQQMER